MGLSSEDILHIEQHFRSRMGGDELIPDTVFSYPAKTLIHPREESKIILLLEVQNKLSSHQPFSPEQLDVLKIEGFNDDLGMLASEYNQALLNDNTQEAQVIATKISSIFMREHLYRNTRIPNNLLEIMSEDKTLDRSVVTM